MSVKDITPDAVVTAVAAGHDDVDKLAAHFEVMHVSHTLRTTIHELVEAERLTYADMWVPLMRGGRLAVVS